MINDKKRKRIEKHIKALEKSYENVIEVMKQGVEKDDDGNVKLKDTQKRIFSEGVRTTAETATYLLDLINSKQSELDGVEEDSIKNTEAKKPEKINEGHPLARHLE